MRIPVLMMLVLLSACGNNGAPPYPPEASPATPSPTTAPVTPPAATAMATRAAKASSPVADAPADPRVAYELREKCGEDARLWHSRVFGDGTHAPTASAGQGFTSHYNAKTNDCLAMTHAVDGGTQTHRLTDVLENRDIGALVYRAGAATPSECHVARQVCNSEQEWEALTAPYMTE